MAGDREALSCSSIVAVLPACTNHAGILLSHTNDSSIPHGTTGSCWAAHTLSPRTDLPSHGQQSHRLQEEVTEKARPRDGSKGMCKERHASKKLFNQVPKHATKTLPLRESKQRQEGTTKQ